MLIFFEVKKIRIIPLIYYKIDMGFLQLLGKICYFMKFNKNNQNNQINIIKIYNRINLFIYYIIKIF